MTFTEWLSNRHPITEADDGFAAAYKKYYDDKDKEKRHWTDAPHRSFSGVRRSKNKLSKKAVRMSDKAFSQRSHLNAAEAHEAAHQHHLSRGHVNLARAHKTLSTGHTAEAENFG